MPQTKFNNVHLAIDQLPHGTLRSKLEIIVNNAWDIALLPYESDMKFPNQVDNTDDMMECAMVIGDNVEGLKATIQELATKVIAE